MRPAVPSSRPAPAVVLVCDIHPHLILLRPLFCAYHLASSRPTAETADIKEYVTEELNPAFGEFPECLAKQQKLLCGLSCDPRQSEYVVIDQSLGNQTVTFYIWYCPLANYDQTRIASLTLHPST